MKSKKMLMPAMALALISNVSCANDYSQYEKPTNTIVTVPGNILTADTYTTRLGTLTFQNGMPSEETTQLVYDNLDFQRGVTAYLDGIPVASLAAMKKGLTDIGVNNSTMAVWMERMDSHSLFLTPNTESIYGITWLDVKDGPLVIETPPNVLGLLDDAAFRYVGDVGNAGPDRGKGGKYLLIGPGWQGDYNESDYTAIFRSSSYGNWFVNRGFLGNDNGATAIKSFEEKLKVYPLGSQPQNVKLLNASGVKFNTIHANDFDFYHEVNSVVQYEHVDFLNKETLGILNAIGIAKGKPFAPDARMKAILTEAVAVGNATARAQLFHTRNQEQFIYSDKQWFNPFGGAGYNLVLSSGGRALNARTAFHYLATGITPAMNLKLVGAGSQYALAVKDANGHSFNGANTYRLNVPAKVPVKNFWSVLLYDVQHRSMLMTDQQYPSVTSYAEDLKTSSDGSIDLYFSPEAPEGMESNWIKTDPNGNWFSLFRLYGPQQAWFDQSWKLNDFELVK